MAEEKKKQKKTSRYSRGFWLRSAGVHLHQWLSFSPLFRYVPQAENVFWPGCALMNLGQPVLEPTLCLLQRAIPGIAPAALCCGKPGRSLHLSSAPRQHKRLLAALHQAGVRHIYVACPNCLAELERFAAAEGLTLQTIWEPLLQGLHSAEQEAAATGRSVADILGRTAIADRVPASVYIHDPCPLRRRPQEMENIRILLESLGIVCREPQHSRGESRCCGLIEMLAIRDPQLSKRLLRQRLAEFPRESTITAGCQSCLASFARAGYATAHPLELLFGRAPKRGWAQRLRYTRALHKGTMMP